MKRSGAYGSVSQNAATDGLIDAIRARGGQNRPGY
jgi:hypothetical protein